MTQTKPIHAAASPSAVGHDAPVDGALHEEPGHLIRRAHQLAVATFHGMHGRDVTPVQYAVLRAVHDEPGIDQVTLAQRVALDTSTAADIATRLETKGWLERALLARRQRSLHLTPSGGAVLAQMLAKVGPMHERLLQGLSPAEQTQLLHLLRKLVQLNRADNGE